MRDISRITPADYSDKESKKLLREQYQKFLEERRSQKKTTEKAGLAQALKDEAGVDLEQEKYNTKEKRAEIKELDLSRRELVGKLDLSDFVKLEVLNCSNNQLTVLDIQNCSQLRKINCKVNNLTELDPKFCFGLKELSCARNFLTDIDLSQNLSLSYLDIRDNKLSKQNLIFLSHLVNLKWLLLGNYSQERIKQEVYNLFVGSLESLKNMTRLVFLDISNTNIGEGEAHLELLAKSESDKDFQESNENELEKMPLVLALEEKGHRVEAHDYFFNTNDMLKEEPQKSNYCEEKPKENLNLEEVKYQEITLRDKLLLSDITNENENVVVKTSENNNIVSYATLSYVCGSYVCCEEDCKHEKKCKDHNKECQEHIYRGLKKSLAKAVEACKLIGIDYLWVDQFCINQKSVEEKGEEMEEHLPSYDPRSKPSLGLSDALEAIKDRCRGVSVDGIYSILGLLPYGEEVKPNYKPWGEEYTREELEKILLDVVRIAIQKGSTSIMGGELYINCEPKNIRLNESSIKLIGTKHTINGEIGGGGLKLYNIEGTSIEGFGESIGSFATLKALVDGISAESVSFNARIRLDDADFKISNVDLYGLKETLRLVKEGDVLVIPNRKQWKSNRRFGILVPSESNSACPIDIVLLREVKFAS
ncbi:hypothetical protein C1645_834754 [Glomus cerebriforme]|uniref:Heterokaryon incompatibility domain-containing protein n=1 Tax=Glomus cerebriforme TaxID=658196 RepID=A0A397SJW3_9GLOM|nr:hypothetical protein C1645_834754 [Glomus cerebriforme]